jgi:hypothetical protein
LLFPPLPTPKTAKPAFSADVRYCLKLEQSYVATHPASRLSDGTIDLKAGCVGDPEGGITNLSIQMHSEGMLIPPRP